MQRCSAITDFIQLVSDSSPRPASVIYGPIFPQHDNTTIVGMNSIIFNWDTVLQTADLFRDEVVDCVVETTVSGEVQSQRTFELSFGSANYLGEGDLHSFRGARRVSERLSYGTELATSVHYTLHFYSTDDFYDSYHSTMPLAASLVCVFIIVVISTLFVAYDMFVKRESVENKVLLDSKRVFVKFVSHEIRTPLNTITLGLQLLSAQLNSILGSDGCRSNSPSVAPRLLEYQSTDSPRNMRSGRSVLTSNATVNECLELVDELEVSSKTAVVVLNELINYDKIEMKKFHVEMKICDINTVISGTVRPLVVQAKQSNVKLSLQKDSTIDKSLYVLGDSVKLGQVIR